MFTPSRETGGEINSIFPVLPQTIPFKDSKLCNVPTHTLSGTQFPVTQH